MSHKLTDIPIGFRASQAHASTYATRELNHSGMGVEYGLLVVKVGHRPLLFYNFQVTHYIKLP